jgi:hypothetical protein
MYEKAISKRISRVHVIRFGKSIVGRNKSMELAMGGTMGFVKKKTYKEKSLMKPFPYSRVVGEEEFLYVI